MKAIMWITILAVMLLPLKGLAQEPTTTMDDREKDETSAPSDDSSGTPANSMEMLGERIEKLENENKEQKQELAELKAAAEVQKDEDKLAEIESANEEELNVDSLFSVYGFFDLTFFNEYVYPKESVASIYIPSKATFFLNNINLYFRSQMTQNLQALTELHFTFLPHGFDKEYETIAKMGETEFRSSAKGAGCVPGDNVRCVEENKTEYIRVSNTYPFYATGEEYTLGGVIIERVHLTYTPLEWFNIMAGRYLTPYGIWNVDHGSPVLIPIRIPFMQARRMVPKAQTGLQVFGRLFPASTVFLDYAVTLSNGRGPTEQLFDMDDNKGLGLRLRLSHRKKNFSVAAGGYGYYGMYTDIKEAIVMEMAPDGTINYDVPYPLTSRTTVTESYKEYIAATDFLLEFYGVRLQAEYIHRRVDFTTPGLMSTEDLTANKVNIYDTLYKANYQGNGMYTLLAWQLPLSEWLGDVRLTPYFMYEHGDPMDTYMGNKMDMFRLGLNVKPSPFITLKAEGGYYMMPKGAPIDNTKFILAQLAVSF